MRTAAKWQEMGSQGAAADYARRVAPATSEDGIREALAYHHCADLDDPEITGQTPEEREAALDALTRGYLAEYRRLGGTAVAA